MPRPPGSRSSLGVGSSEGQGCPPGRLVFTKGLGCPPSWLVFTEGPGCPPSWLPGVGPESSTLAGSRMSPGATPDSGTSVSPIGASWRRDTVVSRPSLSRTVAYCGFAHRRSTSSTRGSNLELRTFLFINTGPGESNHVGKELPVVDRLV